MAKSPLRIGTRFLAGVVLWWTLTSAAIGATSAPLILPPDWSELPTDTQQILAPLGPDWNNLPSANRRKWLKIAERYPKMGKDEQQRIQQRMKDWAGLTPAQRGAAREQYKKVRQAPPEQKEALKKKWSEYQALPDDEKERFKRSAAKSPGKPATTDNPIQK